tara:strand:- start:9314 stop:9598 length:285 start_codon:yes stop_codon:yes gene_type:complete
MKQEDLIIHFVNGDIQHINKHAGAMHIETDYDADNMTLWSYSVKVAEKDLESEEITIWGGAIYYSTTTTQHINKLKTYLYQKEIGYIVNNTHAD